jgi:hypothetical protein
VSPLVCMCAPILKNISERFVYTSCWGLLETKVGCNCAPASLCDTGEENFNKCRERAAAIKTFLCRVIIYSPLSLFLSGSKSDTLTFLLTDAPTEGIFFLMKLKVLLLSCFTALFLLREKHQTLHCCARHTAKELWNYFYPVLWFQRGAVVHI